MTFLINAVGYVRLNVRDLSAAKSDAADVLGLHMTDETADVVMMSSNGRRAELILRQSSENSCQCVGLEAVSADAVAEIASRIGDHGGRIVSRTPSLPFIQAAVTFVTPNGHVVEVHTPIPDDLYKRRWGVGGVGPSRIDHLNISTPAPDETRVFMVGALGLRLSERLLDNSLSWMRGANSQHHIISIVRGSVGLHHYAWEFSEFVDFQTLGDVLDRNGRQLMWGPGRHRPGDNIYAYYLDVNGAIVECSHGMARIADENTFQPLVITDLKRPENIRTMNCWGTPAPKHWLEHHFPFAALTL
jgi:catechol 2,3-dioxygenase